MNDPHNPWILTLATVRKGRPFDSICALLGLREGNFHLIRRSCAHPDVQMLFRKLASPISGDTFPEFNWVLTENRPTIFYTKSYSLGSRLFAYLIRTAKSNPNRIRMYNPLNFDSHNAETRELLTGAPTDNKYCQIVIGTNTLSVGVGMLARLDAAIVGDMEDTDELLQKLGRVGRTKTKAAGTFALGIIYTSAAFRTLAQKAIDFDVSPATKQGQTLPDISIARLTLAKCKVTEVNKIYDNPSSDPPCTCATCSKTPASLHDPSCNCSGCSSIDPTTGTLSTVKS
ncbi:hypothetical protein B0H14DRAFT_3777092 [Mycena olivaceomarginata]|nr:hypothetical protein B0H14DRAFT_3777092 [Mycena olivaceomarginata]